VDDEDERLRRSRWMGCIGSILGVWMAGKKATSTNYYFVLRIQGWTTTLEPTVFSFNFLLFLFFNSMCIKSDQQ